MGVSWVTVRIMVRVRVRIIRKFLAFVRSNVAQPTTLVFIVGVLN